MDYTHERSTSIANQTAMLAYDQLTIAIGITRTNGIDPLPALLDARRNLLLSLMARGWTPTLDYGGWVPMPVIFQSSDAADIARRAIAKARA